MRRLVALLDLRPGEGATFAWLAAYLFFFGMAAALGGSGAESIFMRRLGVAALPVFFIQRRYFDIQQGKRILPGLYAGSNIGVVLGGVAVVLLLGRMSALDLVGVWSFLLGLSLSTMELLSIERPPPQQPASGAASAPKTT